MLQEITTKFKCTGYIESLIGGREENQDSAGWTDTPFGLLVLVCDGMGGAKGGKHASTLAVDTIIEDVKNASVDKNPVIVMTEAVAHANEVIFKEGKKEEFKGMGTTLTALLVTEQNAIALHLGDSRIYQLRDGLKVFRTFDHSYVFSLVKADCLTEEQARLSDCSNVILKALGIAESVEPDVAILPYRKGDRFVLCTDGFWSAFEEVSLINGLSGEDELGMVLSSMAFQIDQKGIDEGSHHDNLTAAIIDMGKNSRNGKWGASSKASIITLIVLAIVLDLVIILMLSGMSDKMTANKGEDIQDYVKVEDVRAVRNELDSLKQNIMPVFMGAPDSMLTVRKMDKILKEMDRLVDDKQTKN